MTGRPVTRAQRPTGVTCALTAGGAPIDEETLVEVEKFKAFLRLKAEIGTEAAHREVYGDGEDSDSQAGGA